MLADGRELLRRGLAAACRSMEVRGDLSGADVEQQSGDLLQLGQRTATRPTWFAARARILNDQSMIHYVKATETIGDRVFITGFSAGGAEVALMLAVWPDVFAAGAIDWGIAYRCATTVNEAFSCLSPGRSKSPAQWGDLVRNAVLVVSGAVSATLDCRDVRHHRRALQHDRAGQQWTDVHGIGQTPSSTSTVLGYPYAAYQKNGCDRRRDVLDHRDAPRRRDRSRVRAGEPLRKVGSFIVDKNIPCAASTRACSSGSTRRPHRAGGHDCVSGRWCERPRDGVRGGGGDRRVGRGERAAGRRRCRSRHQRQPGRQLHVHMGQLAGARRSANARGHRDLDAAGNEGTARIAVTVSGGVPDTVPPVVSASPAGSASPARSP